MPFLILRSEADAAPLRVGSKESIVNVLHNHKVRSDIGEYGGFVLDMFESPSPVIRRPIPRLGTDSGGRASCTYEWQEVEMPVVEEKKSTTTIARKSTGEIVDQTVTTYLCKATKEYAIWLCHRPGWHWVTITEAQAEAYNEPTEVETEDREEKQSASEYRDLQSQVQTLISLGGPKIRVTSPIEKLRSYVHKYNEIGTIAGPGPSSANRDGSDAAIIIEQSGPAGNP